MERKKRNLLAHMRIHFIVYGKPGVTYGPHNTHSERNSNAHYGSLRFTGADDENVDKTNTAGGRASRDAVIPAVTFRDVMGHASTTLR